MVSRTSFSQEHCKVITVSFAIGPLVQHYGHSGLTASTRHNGNLSFYMPWISQTLKLNAPTLWTCWLNLICWELYMWRGKKGRKKRVREEFRGRVFYQCQHGWNWLCSTCGKTTPASRNIFLYWSHFGTVEFPISKGISVSVLTGSQSLCTRSKRHEKPPVSFTQGLLGWK